MSPSRRSVTIIVHQDGKVETRSYRIPLWLARTTLWSAIAIAIVIVIATILYVPLARTAARVPGLTQEVQRLRTENAEVRRLASTLQGVEQRYAQVRAMLGGNIIPPAQPESSTSLPEAYPVYARAPQARPGYERGPSVPSHWPLDEGGVVTRGQVRPGAGDEAHPGLDIAIPIGTPIRAAGGGVVSESGDDPEYGLFVQIDHPEGYQTLYGHASRLLVSTGDTVQAGQVIGLSGSTGRSTGPHLHFEVRRRGRSLDPRSMVKEGS